MNLVMSLLKLTAYFFGLLIIGLVIFDVTDGFLGIYNEYVSEQYQKIQAESGKLVFDVSGRFEGKPLWFVIFPILAIWIIFFRKQAPLLSVVLSAVPITLFFTNLIKMSLILYIFPETRVGNSLSIALMSSVLHIDVAIYLTFALALLIWQVKAFRIKDVLPLL